MLDMHNTDLIPIVRALIHLPILGRQDYQSNNSAPMGHPRFAR